MKCKACLATLVGVTLGIVIGMPTANAQFDSFASWAVFDPGEHGVGEDTGGYHDLVFDGRFIYFIPYRSSGSGYSGEVLRFDTTGNFDEASNWLTVDPGAHGVGTRSKGFAGGVFDGRYLYLIPWADDLGFHGEVMRYDTAGSFQDVGSWEAFDPGSNGVGIDPDGYRGGIFDGRYLYFAPLFNGTSFHDEMLRYDTQGAFSDAASWTVFEPAAHGVGTNPNGYGYPAFDGQYLYFSPYMNGPNHHGEVLRYNTGGSFTDPASWTTYNPGQEGLGAGLTGYLGTTYDGRFVYFAPYTTDTSPHGRVLRYDTTGAFDTLAAWAVFDAQTAGLGTNVAGFSNAIFDNQYIYFVPYRNSDGDHGEVLRYNTFAPFGDVSSWMTYEPSRFGIAEHVGYRGGVFDGRFTYFAPGGILDGAHSEILRYDTLVDCNANGMDDACDLDCSAGDGECNVPGCGGSDDADGDGRPDECCVQAEAALAETPAVAKNRFLSFVPGNPGQPVAIRVMFADLPEPWNTWNGTQMWVGEPQERCELGGVPDAGAACGSAATFFSATLQCDPYFRSWTEDRTIHAHHEGIIPGGRYVIQTIYDDCPAAVESSYSPALGLQLGVFGDLCGPFDSGLAHWPAPDHSADLTTDVVALLDSFASLPTALTKTRADIEPATVDLVINIMDVLVAIDAFRGLGYPFSPGLLPCSP